MIRKLRFEFWESLGWLLCELAFKTDCRGLFSYAYRAGCWCYEQKDELR